MQSILGYHQTKLHMRNIVLKPRIAYAYNLVSIFKLDIKNLDKILNKLTKDICNHLPLEDFKIYTTSLLQDCVYCIG